MLHRTPLYPTIPHSAPIASECRHRFPTARDGYRRQTAGVHPISAQKRSSARRGAKWGLDTKKYGVAESATPL
jgi:hypothetical protein